MGDKKETLQAQIQPSLAVLKYSGTLLVSFKEGKYIPLRRLYLFLIVGIVLLCDCHYLINIIKTIVSTGKDIFSAKQFVLISAKLIYQTELFNCCFFVMFKTGRLAELLNGFLRIEQEISLKYNSKLFISIFTFFNCAILGNLIYTYLILEVKTIQIFAYIAIEQFVLSLIYQTLFFVHLTTTINKQLNQVLVSEKLHFNLAHVVKLRNTRELLSDLFDKIQDVLGLAILMAIFNIVFFFIEDVNEIVSLFLSFAYNQSKFSEIIINVIYCVIWSFLDLFLIITAVIVCSKNEFEVS